MKDTKKAGLHYLITLRALRELRGEKLIEIAQILIPRVTMNSFQMNKEIP